MLSEDEITENRLKTVGKRELRVQRGEIRAHHVAAPNVSSLFSLPKKFGPEEHKISHWANLIVETNQEDTHHGLARIIKRPGDIVTRINDVRQLYGRRRRGLTVSVEAFRG